MEKLKDRVFALDQHLEYPYTLTVYFQYLDRLKKELGIEGYGALSLLQEKYGIREDTARSAIHIHIMNSGNKSEL